MFLYRIDTTVIYIHDLDLDVEPPIRKSIEICSLVSEMRRAARVAVHAVCALWT
jgi:hypothetical protein